LHGVKTTAKLHCRLPHGIVVYNNVKEHQHLFLHSNRSAVFQKPSAPEFLNERLKSMSFKGGYFAEKLRSSFFKEKVRQTRLATIAVVCFLILHFNEQEQSEESNCTSD
jgi:hypothetical protein